MKPLSEAERRALLYLLRAGRWLYLSPDFNAERMVLRHFARRKEPLVERIHLRARECFRITDAGRVVYEQGGFK